MKLIANLCRLQHGYCSNISALVITGANRERSFEMAGIGESDVVQPKTQEEIDVALASIHSKITHQNVSVKYYGGCRFYKSTKGNDRWQHFKPYRFVLPLLELCQTEERYFWACNLNGNNNKEEVLHFLSAHLSSTVENEIFVPIFLDRTDLPDYSGWQQLINKALTAISSDELQKVVLARQTTFHATETIDPGFINRKNAAFC